MRIIRKSIIACLISILLLSGTLAGAELIEGPSINLPSEPVTVTVMGDSPVSRFNTILSDVPPGYDVTDGSYLGWCVEPPGMILSNNPYDAYLYSSYDPNMPSYFSNDEWDKVNYILNHKQGDENNWEYRWQIQFAIWYTLGWTDFDTWPTNSYLNSIGWSMVDDAAANGEGFCPQQGEVIAILVDIGETWQNIIIELEVPSYYEGLTPGYWKNHVCEWVGYQPSDRIDDVFDIPEEAPDWIPSLPIYLGLWFKGGNSVLGATKILLHHAIAAVLNTAHPDVDYPLTEYEIVTQVNDALASLNRTTMLTLKDTLDAYNNNGCDDL